MQRRRFLQGLGAGAVLGWSAVGRAAPEAAEVRGAAYRGKLTQQQVYVLFEQGTERAFTGAYWDHHEDGIYHCAACDLALFDSRHKFDSGTGWPSFTQPVAPSAVRLLEDRGWFTTRTEVRCARCDGHQGHVFDDGPKPTGKRYCINSVALRFVARPSKVK